MSVPEIYEVDKMEAAGCQLDTAVELFFENRDMVSILSLTYSAWGIVKNYLKNDQHESIRKYFAENHINRSGGNEIDAWKKLDEMWNFLKHAKDDANKAFQFPSGLCEIVLFSVVHDFAQVFPVTSETMDVYYYWWLSKNERGCLARVPASDKATVEKTFSDARARFPGITEVNIAEQKNMGYKAIQALKGGRQEA